MNRAFLKASMAAAAFCLTNIGSLPLEAATVYPTATGNYSTRTWNNDATGAAYGMAPQTGDTILTNNTTLTLDQSVHVAAISTAAGTTAAAGGVVTASANSLTLTVDTSITSATTAAVTYSGSSPNIFTVTGSGLTINGSATTGVTTLTLSGTGTMNITATAVGGGFANSIAVSNNGTGAATLNFTGNVTGGSASGTIGIRNNTTGTVAVTGNATGGSNANSPGADNISSGTLTVSGTATGGSNGGMGAINASTGSMTVGAATGGTTASSYGAQNASTGNLTCTGNATASSTAPGLADLAASAGWVKLGGKAVNSTGVMGVYCSHLCVPSPLVITIAGSGSPGSYSGSFVSGGEQSRGGVAKRGRKNNFILAVRRK